MFCPEEWPCFPSLREDLFLSGGGLNHSEGSGNTPTEAAARAGVY